MLDVAREVFAEDGYHGAAMEKIAQRAGVTKPVLYQHFSGKKELYVALLDSDMNRLLAHVTAAIEAEQENRARIEQGLTAYFEFIEQNVDTFRLLFRETMGADPEVRECIDRFHDEAGGRIGAIIAEDTGESPELCELLARGLIGMSEAAAMRWLDRKLRVARDDLVRNLTAVTWRGLAGLPMRKEER